MPTEMRSWTRAHLSVHLCDYCPLLRRLRDRETGYYFLMPNRSITAR